MPIDVFKGLNQDTINTLREPEYDYGGLGDLRPGSRLHDEIVQRVIDYAKIGYDCNSANIKEIENVERLLDGFMIPDEIDELRKDEDDRKPINIINPVLYSHRNQFLTAMHRPFFSTPPGLHRFAGPGSPERAAKAAIATKLIGRLSGWFGERSACDTHWGDGYAHGRAYMWGKWSKRTRPTKTRQTIDEDLAAALATMGVEHAPGDEVAYLDEDTEVTREGTEWIPLDNFNVLTDPSTTPGKFQESAFFGWVADTDALLLYGMEDDPEEQLFNCRGLVALAEHTSAVSSHWRDTNSRSGRIDNKPEPPRQKKSTRCHVVYMFIRIIPRDWNLGESKKPQIWSFGVSADRILIKCHRSRTLHGGIPVVCCAPNSRGHHISPVSNLMITMGQQIAIDSLVKQDLDFQELANGGYFILDGTMLHTEDFGRGGGPRVIRMKKRAMGRPISEMYHQVQISDVTSNNYAKADYMLKMAEKGGGISEDGADMPDHAGSIGINAITSKSVSQMGRIALLIDEQSRQPQGEQNLCNAAQWMDTEVIVDILGREDETIRQGYGLPPEATGLMLGHWDIDPYLDVVPLAAMSGGPKNVTAMMEFLKTLTAAAPEQVAQYAAKFHVEEFLTAVAREMGIYDVDWYRYNLNTMPNEQVLAQQQAGNLVSMRDVAQTYGVQR